MLSNIYETENIKNNFQLRVEKSIHLFSIINNLLIINSSISLLNAATARYFWKKISLYKNVYN